jgi:two-component system nitrogen regulation sensor histidine kinase GlnL
VLELARNGFAKNIRLTAEYDPSLPPVYGDKDQLVQVFLNLVKNAAEAVDMAGVSDGEITIKTAFRHGVRLAVPGLDTRMHLPMVVMIRDNGPGIPDDIRRHLFDPFITTKQGGSGLGLALAAKLVGDHGGVIDVESRPRRTVFSVMLPMVRAGTYGDHTKKSPKMAGQMSGETAGETVDETAGGSTSVGEGPSHG